MTLSWLAVRASQVSRGWRIALVLVATGISISTVFVKQHYVVDVVLGYALAWGAWKLAIDVIRETSELIPNSGDPTA